MKRLYAQWVKVGCLSMVLLLAACHHSSRPADVMRPEQMVDFLCEAYLIESFYAVETGYRYDVLTEHALQSYDSLLQAQGLTRQQAERSLAYYADHLDEYQVIFDSVEARLAILSEKE